MKNQRVVVSQHGGPEVLHMVEEDLPEPEPAEARVKVLAAGVSAYDLMHRRSGLLPGTPVPRRSLSPARPPDPRGRRERADRRRRAWRQSAR